MTSLPIRCDPSAAPAEHLAPLPAAEPAQPLRVLLVEDSEDDAGLTLLELENAGYRVLHRRVQTAAAMAQALADGEWDIVLSDYTMPAFSGLEAVETLRASGRDIPLVIISGNIGEDIAVGAMRAGARDYVLKSNLPRLPPAVQRELREAAERRRARAANEQLLIMEHALESTLDPVLIFEHARAGSPIVYVNPAFERVTGYRRQDIIGENVEILQGNDHDQPELELLREAMREERAISVMLRNYRKDGTLFWNEVHLAPVRQPDGRVTHYIGVQNDVTERQRHQAELLHLANHDSLTGLPNRNLLEDRLRQDLAHAMRSDHRVALLALDVEGLRSVNDGLGHEAGDAALKIVAQRLAASVRQGDTVARIGGSRFAVVLSGLESQQRVIESAHALSAAIAEPVDIGGQRHQFAGHIGAAMHPEDGGTADVLLKHADSAAHHAKRAGRRGLQFFSAELNAHLLRRIEIERDLRSAFERGELHLAYQPQVDLRSGAVCGFEALARWTHSERGPVSPLEFIPIAEESGLIEPIGRWVLDTACRQLRAWEDAGYGGLRISVNLSSREVMRADLPEAIVAIIGDTGINPAQLELELTESTVLATGGDSAGRLSALRDLGVALAIDDFGTGYSNFAYLRDFPVDCVKIDRSFVKGVTTNPSDAAICASIASVARALKLRVVAEGVEREGELEAVARYGCDSIQGYLFSRPVGAIEAEALLREGRRLAVRATGARERTLLVVDDEPNITSALRRALRRDGYRIHIAQGAEEGFELLARHRTGVVISDQRMPIMNGTEFLRRVKDLYPDTVRLVLSGYTDLQSVTDAINEGAIYKFLTKPWEDEQLRESVRDAFHHQELTAENQRLSAELQHANARLEASLAAQSERLANDETVLDVAREALAAIPVPVLGIDPSGLIAISNAAADGLFGGGAPLVGGFAAERLPVPLGAQDCAGTEASFDWQDAGGRRWRVVQRSIGSASLGEGALLVLLPMEPA